MEKRSLPSVNDLYNDQALISRQSQLIQLLNANPKQKWIKHHPTITVKDENGQSVPLKYLSIQTVEYLLTSIFLKWRVEVKETKLIANSVMVCVRLYVQDPITMEWDFQDGVGASPIQTDKGAGAIEFNQMKTSAIQMAAPAAESYAIKDAAEKFGKIFGKDLNRRDNYDISAVMEGKIDMASMAQFSYIQALLSTSSLDEPSKQVIDTEISGTFTIQRAGELIDYLKENQLDPIRDTNRASKTEINERTKAML